MKKRRNCGNRLRNVRDQVGVGVYSFLSPDNIPHRDKSVSLAVFRKKAQSFIRLLEEEGFGHYWKSMAITFASSLEQPKASDKLKNLFSDMVLWANDLINEGLLYAPSNYEFDTLESLSCVVSYEFYHSPYGRMPLDET